MRQTLNLFGSMSIIFGLVVGGLNYPPAIIPLVVWALASVAWNIYNGHQAKQKINSD